MSGQRDPGAYVQPATLPSGPITLSVVLKHDAASTTPRELWLKGDAGRNGFIVNAEAYPHLRVEMFQNGAMVCNKIWSNVLSATDFVGVTIVVDGSDMKLYKDCSLLTPTSTSSKCGTADFSRAAGVTSCGTPSSCMRLGANGYKGVMKSFATWSRAFTAAE
eukprot:gene48535-26995_t